MWVNLKESPVPAVDLSMELSHLTPELIERGAVPMDELLKNSVYYPASRTDGRPIEYCNTIWRSLGVNSFVYCDFDVSESELMRDVSASPFGGRGMSGYRVLAHRRLRPQEYIPAGWKLEMAGERYWDSFLGTQDGPKHYAHWVVFERKDTKGILHGPDRLSFLFVCGEGLATFQQLYCSRGIAPRMLCFIQCWGFAGNWTDFTAVGAPFHRTLLKYRACIPEWLCIGDCTGIHGVLRLRGLDYAGVRLLGYESGKALAERFGEDNLLRVSAEQYKDVTVFAHGGRRYAAVSVSYHTAYAVYDITHCRFDVNMLVDYLTLGEEDRFCGLARRLNRWAGIVGEVRAPRTAAVLAAAMGEPVLDEKLDWRDLARYESTSKALAVVRSVSRLFREEGVTLYTESMRRSLRWAEDVLSRGDEHAAALADCRWCLERMKDPAMSEVI